MFFVRCYCDNCYADLCGTPGKKLRAVQAAPNHPDDVGLAAIWATMPCQRPKPPKCPLPGGSRNPFSKPVTQSSARPTAPTSTRFSVGCGPKSVDARAVHQSSNARPPSRSRPVRSSEHPVSAVELLSRRKIGQSVKSICADSTRIADPRRVNQ